MINTIRIKNQPLFKEFTFHKQERELFLLEINNPFWGICPLEQKTHNKELLLTPFEYKVFKGVFEYNRKCNTFTMEDTESKIREINSVLLEVTDIIKVMSLDEVEFIEVDKETFGKWITFREWCGIVGEDSSLN